MTSITAIEFNKSLLDTFSMQNQDYLVDQTYYELPSGEAEYRLYSYMSTFVNGATILDIGTSQGRSAVALSHNPANHVISYDIQDHIHSREYKLFSKSNMEFHIRNVLDDITPEFVSNGHQKKPVQLVMIDICHYGTVERQIMDKLYACGFRGLVLLDDIHHPDPSMREPMEKLWADLPWPKWDVSAVGHYSGTGLVSMQTSALSLDLKI
jgi:hypothetical protein